VPPARSRTATASIVVGALAIVSLPAVLAASEFTARVTLLESLVIGVPTAILLGATSLLAVRVARRRGRRTLRPEGIESRANLGRRLAAAGIYLGITGGLALAFYAVLKASE
jgi:hypothetical protein